MPTPSPTHSRGRVLLAFAVIYILWGSTYLGIRLAIETIPPFLMAGLRFLTAGALLYALSIGQKLPRPTRRYWRNAAIASVPLFVMGNGGVTWAEKTVPSGAAALMVATLPAWLLLLDWACGGRRGPRLIEVLGIGLGLAGVATLTAPGGINLLGAGLLLISSISWAVGSLYGRYAGLPSSPVQTAGMQMLAGGAIMVVVGLGLGEAGQFDRHVVSWQSGLALLYLIAVALVALPAYTWLLSHTSPALVGTYAFVNPLVAVFLGWLVIGEEVNEQTGLAALFVVVGVALLVWPRPARVNENAVLKEPAGGFE